MTAACFALLRLVAPAASALHATQHEFVVAEVVAVWPQLPSSARIQLLPTFVLVHPLLHPLLPPSDTTTPLHSRL
jgi:hypothetical protein